MKRGKFSRRTCYFWNRRMFFLVFFRLNEFLSNSFFCLVSVWTNVFPHCPNSMVIRTWVCYSRERGLIWCLSRHILITVVCGTCHTNEIVFQCIERLMVFWDCVHLWNSKTAANTGGQLDLVGLCACPTAKGSNVWCWEHVAETWRSFPDQRHVLAICWASSRDGFLHDGFVMRQT